MSPASASTPEAVLFDLDGTLIDSAPDLLGALDHVRAGMGLGPCDRAALREYVSRGAAGLIGAGLPGLAETEQEDARNALLDHYESHCWNESVPFDGIEVLLGELEGQGVRLGIVTNKVSRFAEPILARARWSHRFDCLVTGDRVGHPKPHPEPVESACRALGVRAEKAVFVGDDRRDVLSGRDAGVATVVAAWGYIPVGEQPADWGADGVLAAPADLWSFMASWNTG